MDEQLLTIENIETFDNLFVESTGLVPIVIRFFQKLLYKKYWFLNHAGKFIRPTLKSLLVFEADKYGVALTNFNDYLKSSKNLYIGKQVAPLSEDFKNQTIDFMFPMCGHYRYGYFTLFVSEPIRITTFFIFRSINNITKKLFSREWLNSDGVWIGRKEIKANRTFICGKLVAYIEHNFMGRFPKWNEITPVEIANSGYYILYKVNKETLQLIPTSDGR